MGRHLAQDLTGEVRLKDGQMEIPGGLTQGEEWEAIRRMQGRETKAVLTEWLLAMATWRTRADLTFDTVAHPERAEKAVRRWLRKVTLLGVAVVGYERQDRGAVHIHLVCDRAMDCVLAHAEWLERNGWARVEAVESQEGAVAYILKHAIKGLDYEVLDARSAS